ncbi:adenosylhomocysteinase [Legionella birminghamensis]|uniref:Adenosylhomocysteinase n=1 Tax=Legionella birminghamensis TaxID=28083 RepID=A0A378I6L4_9GAMM|nr:NAD(P)-dependent oxidoreductase [Legionella birminghamensis]KTC76038.1 adenosylhomocysteinase [Legionella birminghamensis]STX30799.1 adenosylhomocysteinase [Legionella birminghamensis]
MSNYNFEAFEQARRNYQVSDLPFLSKARNGIQAEQPYRGLTILHNTPLTLATAFKIELLALGGAEVVTSCIEIVPPEQRAIELLQAARIPVQLEKQYASTFDFHLDCCAELIYLPPPRLGAVELTQTGSERYRTQALDYPLVSVDDSQLKVIETFFGTGNGFIRAIQELVGTAFHNQPIIVIGNGKVGRGIIHALSPYTSNITVIDCKPPQDSALGFINAADKHAVKAAIKQAYAVVTATGVQGLMSDYYQLEKADCGDALLINMGADDEFGRQFSNSDVVFDKRPFNFSLTEPTLFRYLDPIFFAHNHGINVILDKQAKAGYNPFPTTLAENIVREWQSIYQEPIHLAL